MSYSKLYELKKTAQPMSNCDKVQAVAMTTFVVVVAPPLIALCVYFAMTGDYR